MASPALNRLETLLAARKLDGTLARPEPARMPGLVAPTGIASLDESLAGRMAPGRHLRSHRRPVIWPDRRLAATLAAATARGELVALVDAFDRLDPVTMAAAGVDLSRVLWVRGPAISLPRPGRPMVSAGDPAARSARSI